MKPVFVIVVRLQFEAIHHWPDCDIDEVLFLRTPHRHIFYVEMKRRVHHDDRDVEFIKFKRDVQAWVDEKWKGKYIENLSCEMIAQTLGEAFGCHYVRVMEDNENGAECYLNENFTE